MNLHRDTMDAYQRWLSAYRWEWFCTLNLSRKTDCATAEQKLKEWRNRMATSNHILIGYMGVFNTVPNPHIHLLALSKRNRLGQTLSDMDPEQWEREWSRISQDRGAGSRSKQVGCTAVIQRIDDCNRVVCYIAMKNMPQGRSEIIQPHHTRIMNKAKID